MADRSINRLTEGYKLVMGLCRMIMFGYAPENLLGGNGADLQCLEFDLAIIFERFILRLLKERLNGSLVSVEYQNYQRDALVNGAGQSYQSTRPDFLLTISGLPITVLDAKFKPRYVSLEMGKKFSKDNKISEDDMYQMLFYVQRARHAAGSMEPQGVIVAPRLDNATAIPAKLDRTIQWLHPGDASVCIKVLYVDLLRTVQAICNDAPFPNDDLSLLCDDLNRQLIPASATDSNIHFDES